MTPLDWTDNEDYWMAVYRGESIYDPRPPDEEDDRDDEAGESQD